MKYLTESQNSALWNRIHGVVFDFDGVLGDTEELQFRKWNLVLKEYGVLITEEEYINNYCGKSSKTEIPELLLKKYPQIPLSQDELVERTQRELRTLFETEAKLVPGALEALRKISAKYKIAICSGENSEQLKMKLDSVRLGEFFSEEVRSDQEKAGKGKPDPAMYILAVKLLGLTPEECVAIEDTASGVISAVTTGLFTIALPNKWTVTQNLSMAERIVTRGWEEFLRDPFPLEL